MLNKDGYPSPEELRAVLPTATRLAKGPVAIYECFQEIPCDLCVRVCPQQAVSMEGLHGLPRLDGEKCLGCGACVGQCPGQAIFTVDTSYAEEMALVRLPFEYLPAPEPGNYACVLDRRGEELGWFKVEQVSEAESHTRVITLAVPGKLALEARNIKAGGYK